MKNHPENLIAKDFATQRRIPHPIPYQGSKRNLSPAISKFIKKSVRTLYEPFAGSAAFTLYAAANRLAKKFVIGDALVPLVDLWELIVTEPNLVVERYSKVWHEHARKEDSYFNEVREEYNSGNDPVLLLYLIARCVKNAVRFNSHGRFTQSVDKRRLGMHPDRMKLNIQGASQLLKGKVSFFRGNFADCILKATAEDLIYMDPPYQGTTYGRDRRYYEGLEFNDLCAGLKKLQNFNVSFLLSYDGITGEKKHGKDLPAELGIHRVYLNAGRSSQATLNGKNAVTLESLYVWGSLTAADVAPPDKANQVALGSAA